MCVSAGVDLAVGAGVAVVGVDAVRHVTRPAQWPLAALPLVFAGHQLVEAFAWWGLEGTVPAGVGRLATWLYLVVAFSLPVLVPVSVLRVEDDPGRRRAIRAFVALGSVVASVLLVALVAGGPWVEARHLHLAYGIDLPGATWWTALYVVATCGGFLASGDARIRVVGLLNLVAVTLLAALLATGVVSLWCAWAAVTSVLVAAYLRSPSTAQQVGSPVPAGR